MKALFLGIGVGQATLAFLSLYIGDHEHYHYGVIGAVMLLCTAAVLHKIERIGK